MTTQKIPTSFSVSQCIDIIQTNYLLSKNNNQQFKTLVVASSWLQLSRVSKFLNYLPIFDIRLASDPDTLCNLLSSDFTPQVVIAEFAFNAVVERLLATHDPEPIMVEMSAYNRVFDILMDA